MWSGRETVTPGRALLKLLPYCLLHMPKASPEEQYQGLYIAEEKDFIKIIQAVTKQIKKQKLQYRKKGMIQSCYNILVKMSSFQ